jgi:hypothetical protein
LKLGDPRVFDFIEVRKIPILSHTLGPLAVSELSFFWGFFFCHRNFQPPSLENLDSAITQLITLEAIEKIPLLSPASPALPPAEDASSSADGPIVSAPPRVDVTGGDLTPLGEVLAMLPVDPVIGKILILGAVGSLKNSSPPSWGNPPKKERGLRIGVFYFVKTAVRSDGSRAHARGVAVRPEPIHEASRPKSRGAPRFIFIAGVEVFGCGIEYFAGGAGFRRGRSSSLKRAIPSP